MRGAKMNIKKEHSNFSKRIEIQRQYIIEMSEKGYGANLDTIALSAASFDNVVIKGDEPFKHNSDVSTLCKAIHKLNPFTNITIYTQGTIRPSMMGSSNNMNYVVFSKLHDKSTSYEQRINESAYKWLATAGAKFIFTVNDVEELDAVHLVVAGLLIKKHQVYIQLEGDIEIKDISFEICHKGYNMHLMYDGEWFDEEDEN